VSQSEEKKVFLFDLIANMDVQKDTKEYLSTVRKFISFIPQLNTLSYTTKITAFISNIFSRTVCASEVDLGNLYS
jgi:hypothetical protein